MALKYPRYTDIHSALNNETQNEKIIVFQEK